MTVETPANGDHEEILRCRERLHKLEPLVAGLNYKFMALEQTGQERLRKLEDWSAGADVELRAVKQMREKYIPLVEEMVKQDAVAEGVRQVLDERGNQGLRKRDQAILLLAACGTVGSFIASFFR